MSNPYLDALQSTSLATGAAEPPNPYLDLLQGAEDARKAQQAAQLSQAVKVDPNQYSAQRRVAQYLGYPVAAAEALPGLADQAKVQKVQQDTASSPLLQQRYSDADFAKLAHDDSGTLAQLGKFVGDLGGSMKAGVFRASRGAAGTFQAGFELIAPALDFLEPVTVVGGNPLRRLAEGFAMQGEAAGRTAALARPKTDGIVAGGFFSGVESLTQNLLTLPMALLPGGQAAALTGMTAFTGGDAYQQAREKGLPMSQALPFAASQAAIEYATEKLPLGKLLQDVKAGAGFLRILGRQIALEVPGEQIATVLQDLNDWAVLNPEKPFSTYLEERPSAAAQTLIATIVGTGGNVAVVKGLETMMSRAVRDGANMQQAGLVGQALEQAMRGAEASLLRERSPEQFRTLMSEMSEDGSLYVDAAVLNQMPAEVLAQLPGVTEALQTATADTPVEVKLADALTVLPGTPEAQVFLQNARTAPDAPSLAEAEAAGQKAQEFLQQEAARVIEQAQDQEALRQSQEAVKQNIRQQLAATGRFRDAVNEGYATWAAAFYTAYGSRLGMTPEQFYQRYPLRVLGAPVGQQTGVLNAGAPAVELGGRQIPITLNRQDEQAGFRLVPVNSAAFDAGFRAADTEFTAGMYVGPGGTGAAIGDRYQRFGEFSATAPSIEAPTVSVDAQGRVSFGNGRHRFAFMRDSGVPSVPVAMDEESLQNAIAAGYVDQGVLEQRGVQAKGKAIPDSIDTVSNVESSFQFAGSQQFPNNRDFKLAIQARVLEAAKAAKVKLDEFTQGVEQYLVRIAVADGQTALRTNANAVGWYNEKVTKALRLVSLIHPEIATDPQAKFAFVWAMAVTSNGLKVDKNFELAEKVYQGYKATGQMPTDVGIGTAAEAINRSLGLYNTLIAKHGFDVVEKFMTTLQPAGEVEKFTGQKVSGENKTTMVYGAAALGPKIGNGFFMNLYGRFEQLTMDRWLMRTWGRWTGTLVESNPAQVKAKRTALKALIQSLTPADKKAFEAIIKRKLTVGDIDAVGQAIWKASQKPANRVAMAKIGVVDEAGQAKLTEILGEPKKDQVRVSIGDELRKGGNALTKYLDGQKEAPAGPPERGNIRKVFSRALAELQKQHPALTMSDFQALLWYPEKRLYDAAKTAEEAADAYEDDEAPDYANAAAKLARAQGVPDADISATVAAVDAELQAAVGAAGVRPGERGPGDSAGSPGQQVLNQAPAPAGFKTKVVDEAGNPRVVYHGTTADIRRFDASRRGENTGAESATMGFFFTDDTITAESYANYAATSARVLALVREAEKAEAKGDWDTYDAKVEAYEALDASFSDPQNRLAGQNVVPVYLEMQNPLRVDAMGENAVGFDIAAAVKKAVRGKYDGLIIDNLDDAAGLVDRPATHYVVFDPKQIVSAVSGETLAQGPRGTFNPQTLELVLNPNADLSTWFHETGHFFLEVLADVASQPDAPAQIVEDYNKVLAWFGVTPEQWAGFSLDEKRPYHERWAESIEQYVMEGKAPSVELQPVMRRFRAWLTSVYGSIKRFLAQRGVPVAGGETLGQGARRFSSLRGMRPTASYVDATPRQQATLDAIDAGPDSTDFDLLPAKEDINVSADSHFTEWEREPGVKFVALDLLGPFTGYDNAKDTARIRRLADSIKESNAIEPIFVGIDPNGEAYVMEGQHRVRALQLLGETHVPAQVIVSMEGTEDDYAALPEQPQPGPTDYKAVAGQGTLFQGDQQQPLNIQLNDDIRRVMDRMLATDEQIAQANEVAGLMPDEQADGEAAERLQRRSMADLKWAVKARDKVIAKLKRQAREIEKGIREQVTVEVDAMPEMQAKRKLDELRKAKQLDDAALAAMADAFGYESVDAMLQAIDAFGKRADAIDGLTERRMLEDHGDLVDEAAIQEAANEAVHNEARARSLATELRTQREMLGARTDTGQTNARGARITVNTLVEAAKQFGANVIARTPLKDLRSTAWKHTAAERRAGKRWAEATAAGDTQAAVQAKQDQMLNNAAAKAALDAATEAKKILEFFARVTKGNDEKTVEKGRDPDIVNAARAVLAAYGIETPTTKGAAAYLETVKANDPDTYAAIEPMIAAATQNAQPLEALTFEELQGLAESIRAMWFLAKRSRQMEVDGDLMDIDDVAGELFARLEAIGIPDRVPGEGMAVTKEEERGLFLKQGIAFLRRVEQWAEGMDGKYGGPFLRYVFQPIKDAADRYRKDRLAYRKKFQALVDNLAPIVGDSVIQAPELGYTFGTPGSTAGTAMNEILHAIAHTGNESNKRKLLLGRGWATENPDGTLDTSRWDAFLQRLANEGKLERAHFDFVQGVWDLLEQTKPLAQKAHRDAFGRYFSEVTADAFVDPFGVTRRGGYVPAQVDSRLVKDNVLRKMAEEENNSMAYAFPQPAKGFTMARTEYNRPLMLDLRSLSQHLDKVLLFSHMTNPARDVRKLITRKTVSQPLDRIQPAAIESMLQPWLQRSAQQVVEDPIVGAGKWARVPSVIRARAGMALMFANVSNAIQQVTGLSSAAVRVKPAFLMRSLAQYITHPVKFSQAVWAASPYMDDRAKNEVAVMNEQMQAILIQPSTYEKVKDWSMRHAYFLQTALDNVLSPIVWTGAFNQALAEGMSDADAVRFADGTVRQTQGSTLPEDVSRFETGPAYARAFTQFVGYFNMVANTNATALKQIAGEVGLKKGAGRAFSVVMLGLLAPIWMAEAIALAFKGGPDDEDEDGSIIDDWVASVFGFGTAKGLLAMIPILGQAANSAVTRLDNNPMNDRISLSPGLSLLESALGGNVQTVYELLNDEKEVNARRAVRDAATLVSVFTGVPVYALARPAGYAAGVAQGKIEPTGPVDVARGLLTGTASPESKAR